MRNLSALFSFAIAAAALAAPAQAAQIKAQDPCTSAGHYCKSFTSSNANFVVRHWSFTAPTDGSAQFTFHGSVVCDETSGATDRVVDFASQIVTDSSFKAHADGLGGLRLATVLKDSKNNTTATTGSFNLTSTRVMDLPNGKTVDLYFKILLNEMSANVTCYIYNATFSVVFGP